MIQQVADCDGLPVCGKLRKDIREVVVVSEFFVADEQHDAGCGELLGERGEAEVGFRIDGMEGAEIGDTISATEYGVPIVDDEHGSTRRFGGFQRGEDGVNLTGRNLCESRSRGQNEN